MATQGFTIRLLKTVEEYRQAELTQQKAWNVDDLTQIVPTHVTLTAQKNGGLVAGAFDESDRMLGFVFGFIGMTPQGKLKHCSHMAGVLPEARHKNVGYALKLYQRDFVRVQGFDLITWTFDPMEGLNANLNIAKLGVVAHTYYENLYGEWLDGLNKGIPTDRFEVEWWIDSPRVEKVLTGQRQPTTVTDLLAHGAAEILETKQDDRGLLHFTDVFLHLNADVLIVEIPGDFQQIKAASMDLAKAWRIETRTVFQAYFAKGYRVAEFLTEQDGDRRRNYYVLMRTVPDLVET